MAQLNIPISPQPVKLLKEVVYGVLTVVALATMYALGVAIVKALFALLPIPTPAFESAYTEALLVAVTLWTIRDRASSAAASVI